MCKDGTLSEIGSQQSKQAHPLAGSQWWGVPVIHHNILADQSSQQKRLNSGWLWAIARASPCQGHRTNHQNIERNAHQSQSNVQGYAMGITNMLRWGTVLGFRHVDDLSFPFLLLFILFVLSGRMFVTGRSGPRVTPWLPRMTPCETKSVLQSASKLHLCGTELILFFPSFLSFILPIICFWS